MRLELEGKKALDRGWVSGERPTRALGPELASGAEGRPDYVLCLRLRKAPGVWPPTSDDPKKGGMVTVFVLTEFGTIPGVSFQCPFPRYYTSARSTFRGPLNQGKMNQFSFCLVSAI